MPHKLPRITTITTLFSVFKNAMRAVVEQHGSSIDIPPLKILITKGKQDLTIKVSGTCVKYDPKYYVFSGADPGFF